MDKLINRATTICAVITFIAALLLVFANNVELATFSLVASFYLTYLSKK